MKNKHKKINFFDPQINVKKKLVNEKFQYLPGTKIPLPSEVEISESGPAIENVLFVREVIPIIWT